MTALASMTGYARAEGVHDGGAWLWEIKSVNGRGLDVRCRLGPGFDRLEPEVRRRAAAVLARGSVSATLHYTPDPSRRTVTVNRDLVRSILDAAADVAGDAGSNPSLDAVFTIPGVVEVSEAGSSEGARDALDVALLSGLDDALAGLQRARRDEGGRIAAVLEAQIGEMSGLLDRAAAAAAAQPGVIRERLRGRIADVLEPGSVSEDRVAQEVAMLALKADVREELDRLAAHASAAQDFLAGGGAAGRRLDFLSQELAREANTLCAKSADSELTATGLALKTAVDQFREQVQNLE
jgi:uncharacterized protein (TIGR00255 family)